MFVIVSIPRRDRRKFPRRSGYHGLQELFLHVSIPRRGRRKFPLNLEVGTPNQIGFSQYPEGIAGNFHVDHVHTELVSHCLNPPKGSPAISTRFLDAASCRRLELSQSPEGIAGNFHLQVKKVRPRATKQMSQSPEGIAGNFHIGFLETFRRGQEDCLNPPKGSAAISTRWIMANRTTATELSQSPEGIGGNFHVRRVQRPEESRQLSQSPEGLAGNFHKENEP